MPDPGGGSPDRTQRPTPGPAPKVQLPRFRRERLDNGLSVLTVRHDDLPETSARLILPSGAASDPEGRAGTALLVARALTEGTEDRSAREVAEALDYLGAQFRVQVSQDATILSMHFLSHVFEPAIELLAEIVTRPAFEPTEVERLKDERLDEIASSLDEPRIVANLRLIEAVFGGHPYGTREGGTEDSVRVIEPDGLRRFHSARYRPGAGTLILVGDVPDDQRLNRHLAETFSSWQDGQAPDILLPEPEPLDGRRVWAVDWPGTQSEIRIGGLGIARRDPDYHAVMVSNAILGGLFSSRINMNLREDKGWTYGAHSRFDARRRPGPFYAATAVDAEATLGAVTEMLNEMERMETNPPTDEELQLAKNALTFSLPRLFETVTQVSGRVAQQVIHSLPDDYWEVYPDHVGAVEDEDVRRVADRLLDTQRTAVVIVGPVRHMKDDLESLGPLEYRDIRGRLTTP